MVGLTPSEGVEALGIVVFSFGSFGFVFRNIWLCFGDMDIWGY